MRRTMSLLIDLAFDPNEMRFDVRPPLIEILLPLGALRFMRVNPPVQAGDVLTGFRPDDVEQPPEHDGPRRRRRRDHLHIHVTRLPARRWPADGSRSAPRSRSRPAGSRSRTPAPSRRQSDPPYVPVRARLAALCC